MVCKNCGKPMKEGVAACPSCKTKSTGYHEDNAIYKLTGESKKKGAITLLSVLVIIGLILGGCIGFVAFRWIGLGSIMLGFIISFFYIFDLVQRFRFQTNTELTVYTDRIEGVSCQFSQLLMLRADTQYFSCMPQEVKSIEPYRGVILRILTEKGSFCVHAGNKSEAKKICALLNQMRMY